MINKKKSETELGNWYSNIVLKAELADYGVTRGDIVIRPYGFAIWEQIIVALNEKLQSTGHQQAYFPLLLPEKLIEDEKKYIENLSPKVFTVTKGGGDELKEPLVIRPTSETIISYMFAKWIKSHRDLPLKLYQWSNIARWEERTRPFIKGREILWLEGHTAHSCHADAINEVKLICNIFEETLKNSLSIPVIFGQETESRKFVGSLNTYTAEAIMPNGQALQLAAVYDLGQIFSNAFDISFHTSDNKVNHCWTTNWGLGFRLIGSLILVHGDDRGLRLPPKIAPTQIIIIPVFVNKRGTEEIKDYCSNVYNELVRNNFRIGISNLEFGSVKQAIEYWEMKGVPIIILIGNQEINKQTATILRRDYPLNKNKIECSICQTKEIVSDLLKEIQISLYEQALNFQTENITAVEQITELEKKINDGWVVAKWCNSKDCENKIISQFGKIIKCTIPDFSEMTVSENCFACNSPANNITLFAKSY